jgi:hypothetical protein
MAPGSQTGFGVPRECSGCGATLRMNGKDALWLDSLHRQSWHFACKLATLNRRHAA